MKMFHIFAIVKLLAIFTVLCLSAAVSAEEPSLPHLWETTKGDKILARFIGIDGEKVRIEGTNGQRRSVLLKDLTAKCKGLAKKLDEEQTVSEKLVLIDEQLKDEDFWTNIDAIKEKIETMFDETLTVSEAERLTGELKTLLTENDELFRNNIAAADNALDIEYAGKLRRGLEQLRSGLRQLIAKYDKAKKKPQRTGGAAKERRQPIFRGSFLSGTFDVSKYFGHIPTAAPVEIYTGHVGSVWGNWQSYIAISKDDSTLVFGLCHDALWLKSYNLKTKTYGSVFQVPNNDRSTVSLIISSKDTDICYAGFGSGLVCEYSIKSGKILRSINTGNAADKMVINRTGTLLYISGVPAVWNLITNRVIKIGKEDGNCLALDNSERLLAVGGNNGILYVHDLQKNGTLVNMIPITKYPIWSVKFTKDGKNVLVGSGSYAGEGSELKTAGISIVNINSQKTVFRVIGFDAFYDRPSRIGDAFFNTDESLLFAMLTASGMGSRMEQGFFIFDTKTMTPVFAGKSDYNARNAVMTSDEKSVFLPPMWWHKVILQYTVPDRETIDKTVEELKKIR
jgi:hypothetical protein